LRNGDTPIAAASATRPNFFVIGAAKSGTSALWHHLQEHPQIYMSPRKQTRFFAFAGEQPDFRGPVPKNLQRPYAITDLETYHALFDGVRNETAIGEASWTYLYRPEASERIREYAPEAKLIAILRNPADRAYSHYRQNIQTGREPLAHFHQALVREEVRIRDNWWPEFHYVQMGLYSAQLKRYFDTFHRDQIKIYLYEDLDSDPYGLLRDIFKFLGVDDTFTPEAIIRSNPSGAPKSRSLHALLQRLETIRPAVERLVPDNKLQTIVRFGRNLNNRNITHLPLSPEERRRIIDEYFREDILNLQDLIQRDIGAWLGSHRETTAAR
jgi:Sulfotransferase family